MRVAGNTLEASCCRTCRRRCAKRILRHLLAAAEHASGLPRATTPRVDPRLPSTPSPLVMACFSAQSLGRLFASPAQVRIVTTCSVALQFASASPWTSPSRPHTPAPAQTPLLISQSHPSERTPRAPCEAKPSRGDLSPATDQRSYAQPPRPPPLQGRRPAGPPLHPAASPSTGLWQLPHVLSEGHLSLPYKLNSCPISN